MIWLWFEHDSSLLLKSFFLYCLIMLFRVLQGRTTTFVINDIKIDYWHLLKITISVRCKLFELKVIKIHHQIVFLPFVLLFLFCFCFCFFLEYMYLSKLVLMLWPLINFFLLKIKNVVINTKIRNNESNTNKFVFVTYEAYPKPLT